MRIDTHVSRRSTQALSLTIGNVLFGLGISVLLGHAEIYDMNHSCSLGTRTTDEEIVRFDIPINEIFLVNGLHSMQLDLVGLEGTIETWARTGATYHLFSRHAHGLDAKLAATHVE